MYSNISLCTHANEAKMREGKKDPPRAWFKKVLRKTAAYINDKSETVIFPCYASLHVIDI